MQGLLASCEIMHALESYTTQTAHLSLTFAQSSEESSGEDVALGTMLTSSCSLLEILLPLCISEAELQEVLTLFIKQVRSVGAVLSAVETSSNRGEFGLDIAMLLLDLCSTVGEKLCSSSSNKALKSSLNALNEVVWIAVQTAVRFSVLDESSCCTKNDPTSEIGPEYVQGECGQIRKHLRDALRQNCRAFPGILPQLCMSTLREVERFASRTSQTWVLAEAFIHATTAVTKILILNPPHAIALLNMITHPALGLPCRPIHKLAVVLVGDLLPPLLHSKHLRGDEEIVTNALNVVISSLHCTEESPRRLCWQEESTLPGAALAFRLKQDHIGIVSLDRLLSCAALPLTEASRNKISAADVWQLLSPTSGTTFKSCLLAAGVVTKALVRTQQEATMFAPLVGAVLLHITSRRWHQTCSLNY